MAGPSFVELLKDKRSDVMVVAPQEQAAEPTYSFWRGAGAFQRAILSAI